MHHAAFKPPMPSTDTHPRQARRVLRRLPMLVAAVIAVALHGCEPHATDHRVVGVVLFNDPRIPDWPPPQIPTTATAGVPLELTIETASLSCSILRKGYTEVTATGRSALVVPIDILTAYSGGYDPGCFPGWVDRFEHTATVVFEEPGTAEIVLVYSTGGGRLRGNYAGDGRKVYTVEVSAPEVKPTLH